MSRADIPEPTAAAAVPTGDEPLYEVVNGVRVEIPPMGVPAVWIASYLASFLGPHVRTQGLGIVLTEMLAGALVSLTVLFLFFQPYSRLILGIAHRASSSRQHLAAFIGCLFVVPVFLLLL